MISPPSGYKLLREGVSKETDWSAILGAPSGCWMDEYERRRILLWRTFEEDAALAPLALGMMNPSYARHDRVDNTVTRCIGYGRRERAGRDQRRRSPWRRLECREVGGQHGRVRRVEGGRHVRRGLGGRVSAGRL